MAFRNRLMGVGAAFVIAAGLGLSACGNSTPSGQAAAAAEESAVAALVNGQPIYVSDVNNEGRVQNIIDENTTLEPDSAEFNEILDQLIDIKLLAQEAIARGLDEDPQARHRLETARENILGNILVDSIVQERVDEPAIKKMYDTQVAIWELGDEAHIRHILAANKEDIDKVAAELKGGADFAVLASKRSLDEATKMDGGDLGYMTEEEATPEFAKVIRDTPTGGVSKPFEDDTGWHVVKIDDRRKEQPPSIEELRGPILKHLTMMQIGEVLKQLRQEAKIEKQTSPRNSTLDVDPFTLAPDETNKTQAAPQSPPGFEARAPVADSRDASAPAATPAPAPASAPATATPAKPPAATPSPPPAAQQKPAVIAPSKPTTITPAKPATTTPPTTPKPASTTPPAAPSGPVSESRQGAQQ